MIMLGQRMPQWSVSISSSYYSRLARVSVPCERVLSSAVIGNHVRRFAPDAFGGFINKP